MVHIHPGQLGAPIDHDHGIGKDEQIPEQLHDLLPQRGQHHLNEFYIHMAVFPIKIAEHGIADAHIAQQGHGFQRGGIFVEHLPVADVDDHRNDDHQHQHPAQPFLHGPVPEGCDHFFQTFHNGSPTVAYSPVVYSPEDSVILRAAYHFLQNYLPAAMSARI